MEKFLRNLSYIFIVTLSFNSLAKAESISQQELQQRFNKAFSVFHAKNASNVKVDPTTSSKQDSKKPVEEEKIQLSTSDKNIVKTKNNVQVEKRTRAVPKQLTLPSIPRNDSGESIILTELGERPIFIDSQGSTMKEILEQALHQAAPKEHWKIRWRLKDEHKYLLKERINITAEVNFDNFVGNMIDSIGNITGIKLSTKVFYKNRVIIITDTF